MRYDYDQILRFPHFFYAYHRYIVVFSAVFKLVFTLLISPML